MTSEFEDLIREAMHEHNATLTMPARVLEQATARDRRRRYMTRAVTGSALVATTTVAAVAIGAAQPAKPGATAPPSHATASPTTSAPAVETVGYVTARAVRAVDAADAILYSRNASGGPLDEQWSDTRTGTRMWRLTEAGKVTGSALDAGGAETYVDYTDRYWWVSKLTSDGDQPDAKGLDVSRLDDPRVVRAALAGGQLTLDGHHPVAGHDMVLLTATFPKGRTHWTVGVWVDPTSFLPARVAYGPSATALNDVFDLTWLPRSASNLARFTLTPPAGFTRVPPNTSPPGSR